MEHSQVGGSGDISVESSPVEAGDSGMGGCSPVGTREGRCVRQEGPQQVCRHYTEVWKVTG